VKLRKLVLVLLTLTLILVLAGCKKGQKTTTTKGPDTTTTQPQQSTTTTGQQQTTTTRPTPSQPTVIRVAIWWQAGDDPTYRDPATGEYPDAMPIALREARLQALETVKEQLNVEIQFVQYQDVFQEVLQSVLANDPIAEIVGMWGGSQGTVIGQNVFQDITEFRHLFGDEAFWMLGSMDMFGKTMGFSFQPNAGFEYWPLVYNITMLQECDELVAKYSDDDGNVIIPAQLWAEDRWDWDTFKDYLSQIKACYTDKNKTRVSDRERIIHAYEEDYRFAINSLAASNGEYVVRKDGTLGIDSDGFIEAIEFVQDLYNSGIMWTETYDDGFTPGWLWNTYNFNRGEAVFTSAAGWLIGSAVDALKERGEELGIVPWPKGPQVKQNPELYNYHTVYTGGNSFAIPKGVPKDKVELAIKAWVMYMSETFKNLGHENTMKYIESENAATAAKYFSITHEVYGESLKKAYNDWVNAMDFDAREMMNIGSVDEVFAKIVAQKLDARTTIAENKAKFEQILNEMRQVLQGSEIVDNQPPVVKVKDGKELVFKVGTNLQSDVDLAEYLEAYDIGQDKGFSIADVEFDFNAIDNSKPNNNSKLKAKAVDNKGNEKTYEFTVIFYEESDEEAPIIELKSDVTTPIKFKLDYNLGVVNWTDYVNVYDKIVDADGNVLKDNEGKDLTFDLAGRLQANIESVDVTTPGQYTVVLTVIDYAGNETSFDLTIEIVLPEE